MKERSQYEPQCLHFTHLLSRSSEMKRPRLISQVLFFAVFQFLTALHRSKCGEYAIHVEGKGGSQCFGYEKGAWMSNVYYEEYAILGNTRAPLLKWMKYLLFQALEDL